MQEDLNMKMYLFVAGLSIFAANLVDCGTLTGRVLEITTIHSPPLVIVNNASTARFRGKYEGLLIDVLRKVSAMANFTYQMHVVGDSMYGFESSPGVWTGMIGEIMNNVADIAVAPLTITATRAKSITFTQPIMDAGLRIVYRKSPPDVPNMSLLILLAPFTTGLWFFILGCFALSSLAFFAIGKLSPFEELQENAQVSETVPLTTALANSLVYAVSCFMHHDRKSVPRSPSGRVLSAFWWIFTTLVVTTFAANFTAFILSKTPDIRTIPFQNFDELSKQTDVKYGTFAGGSTQAFFKNSKRPMESRMWKQMSSDASNFVNGWDNGLAKVRSENYAFISEGLMAKYYINIQPCDLMVVGPPIERRAYAFVCGINSDVCSLLNPFILRLSQGNFMQEAIRKWVNPGQCSGSFMSRVVRLRGGPVVDAFTRRGIKLETQMSFDRFSAAFFLLIGGIVLSLVALGGEIFYVSKFGLPPKE